MRANLPRIILYTIAFFLLALTTSLATTSLSHADTNAKVYAQRSDKPLVFTEKIERQIPERGWTDQEVRDLANTEPTGTSIDSRFGTHDPALVYGKKGQYIVVNKLTGEIIQISNKNNPKWTDDPHIHWK